MACKAAARIIVGALLLGSVVQGHLASWALGFLAMLLAWQWLRARRTSARLEVTGPLGHALNLAVPTGCCAVTTRSAVPCSGRLTTWSAADSLERSAHRACG
jgi:hypothetical protein